MGRPRTSLAAALAAACLSLALAPAAQGDAFDRVFEEYQGSGRIDACEHSEKELEQAGSSIPNDIDAYAPDFRNALEAALELRAGGGCASDDEGTGATSTGGGAAAPGASTETPTTTTPATTPAAPGSTVTPGPTPDPTAAPVADDQAIADAARTAETSGGGTPAPVVALGVLGALLALGGLAYGLAFFLAWDPRWAQRMRHAVAEAGWRTGNTWSEFADWVRLGR
jgi:hypothetical protein